TDWQLESVLMDKVRLVDTTAFHHEGTWYFFSSTLEQPEEAYLFTADRLDGAWQYHPANPISSDTRHLRGAGAIFQRGGRMIRPSQDCSKGYGYAAALREIRQLSTSRYEEVDAGVIP